MSRIDLINGSCADQNVDAVVNAANNGLWAGAGICGVIFNKAGMAELTDACSKYKTPLSDGDAVITPSFKMTNTRFIIHAVGPNFAVTPRAFDKLFDAYYNSLAVLKENGCHSISFPLISSGIFGGNLDNPVAESAKQCMRAYRKFTADNPDYDVDVKLCAFTASEMQAAAKVFEDFHKTKSYRFYGWETADIKDKKGLTPRDYYDRLMNIWSEETCAPRLRGAWSLENKTLGQCSITAFLMQDIYGGKVYGIQRSDGNFHCFNDVDGCVFDLTSEQFGDEILDYFGCPEQFREVHFQKEEKRHRYELLKERLLGL